ncbi:serine/threonine-protein kinase CTR1-like [Diospyros lotus]|uniref:serine/threonine-protein kinase CTR1-like n=1 Tax=Diospyros lotus TaxID=55363 RepID=UPI00224D814C|nr:serine/threonine-protein kinase CTR1-like [Diospyros lotus]XP_052172674.1 serine/threonine-protein kinase CTR1-like [Diospyros lotus]
MERRSNYSPLSQEQPDEQEEHAPPRASAMAGAGTTQCYESLLSGERKKSERGLEWEWVDQRMGHAAGRFGGSGVGQHHESLSGDRSRGRSERGMDWDWADHRVGQIAGRFGGAGGSTGLQRQSSGSSFGESSMSSSVVASGDHDAFGHLHDDIFRTSGGGGGGVDLRFRAAEESAGAGGSTCSKSWARQTEESYQLQLALALRMSKRSAFFDDSNFLDPERDEFASHALPSSCSAEAVSFRFWVNGCLSYFDKIPDGFYLIHGMDPYAWALCTDLKESGVMPSVESLKAIDPGVQSSMEVILIDRHNDPSLKELTNRILRIAHSCASANEIVNQLAKIVCNRMGGAASNGEDGFVPLWKECKDDLKESLGSVVLPIGSLSVGLCKHRALLFKVLADIIDLPCRIAKGCKYCKSNDAASCLVRFALNREFSVDLIGEPGCLYGPDSLLNGPSSVLISSPLHYRRLGQCEPSLDSKSMANLFFSNFASLDIKFDDSCTGVDDDASDMACPMQSVDGHNKVPSSSSSKDIHHWDLNLSKSYDRVSVTSSVNAVKDPLPLKHLPLLGHGEVQPLVGISDPKEITAQGGFRFAKEGQIVPARPTEGLSLDVEDLDIPWSDLVLKERIGAGSFGVVHRGDWQGSDVAVKILMDQDFHPERLKEFLREVTIMKRLRHPNIVLFMGAVTQPPNLSIVTEYLSRGSLFRLLHKPGAREALDERRRLSMAYDVAKGMNYLHKRHPPIVHRDLKSPNLLVDKKYTVKVCDFGLSRLKASTFLSSKSAAGTPEWMAPEVLRDEPSNEKSDVYSFGVILWELATMREPWIKLNPPQVVAAVGFQGKRLEIPRDLNPQVASIIEACWANDPLKRPSFSNIMESLRHLVKPP